MTTERPVVVWFRQDLRISDQAALSAAAQSGLPVIPLFILDDETPGDLRIGGASRWWLHGSLQALAEDLQQLGAPLVLRRGPAVQTIMAFVHETSARAVFCTRQVEPFWRAADCELEGRLQRTGRTFRRFEGATIFDAGAIVGRDGRALRVFSPFWRACLAAAPPAEPLPPPPRLRAADPLPASEELAHWSLRPSRPDWASGLRETWRPGARQAQRRLSAFLADDLLRYGRERDRPEPAATSRLSPFLHFGEVSPREAWHAAAGRCEADARLAHGAEAYLRELVWREFYADVLARHPDMAEVPMQGRFADFPWRSDEAALRAWQQGRTGYPIVDAGMRQLWQTGWMHNRVRMIVASFLIKDLLVPWQSGEAWFWDTLVDADLGNNAGGWQWVAGCGTDAAPYFRIFNPTTQGERFDPKGAYVRRWVPELARVDDCWIHKPWRAPALQLEDAGVRLGRDYPLPIVDHAVARDRALAAFARLKDA